MSDEIFILRFDYHIELYAFETSISGVLLNISESIVCFSEIFAALFIQIRYDFSQNLDWLGEKWGLKIRSNTGW